MAKAPSARSKRLSRGEPFLEIARLGNDGVAAGLLAQQSRHRGRESLAGLGHPDGPGAAKHRHGEELIGKSSGIACQVVVPEVDDAKGVIEGARNAPDKGPGGFVNLAGIGAIDEKGAGGQILLTEETCKCGRLDEGHPLLRPALATRVAK